MSLVKSLSKASLLVGWHTRIMDHDGFQMEAAITKITAENDEKLK